MGQPVEIKKGAVGANTVGSSDSISGMIMGGIATADVLLGDVKTLYSTNDAEALGLTAAYDTDNNVRVWYAIKEFFRKYGNSTKLYIMIVDQSLTMETLLLDATSIYFKKMVIDAKGEMKQFGVIKNVPADYIAVILDGMDDDVLDSIAAGQAAAQWAWDSDRPLNILIEGRELTGAAAAVQDLRAIADLDAEEVSVVIAQDWDYAETLDALGKVHASVGTALGCLARRKVNENIGEIIDEMNLADATTKDFLTPGLSSHAKTIDLEDDLPTLDVKGYIYALSYTDYNGVYFNNDHTCTQVIIDAQGNMNHHQISHGRTIGKAKRRLRTVYMPKINSVQPLDPATGKLPIERIKYLEAIGDQVFSDMARPKVEEISFGKTTIDPDSDLLTPPKELLTSFYVIPYGTVAKIKGTINLKQRT